MPASDSDAGPFPLRHLSQVQTRASEQSWLVEGLWSRGAVGFIAGAPKCCKTWLACEIALAVATGSPALGRFPVHCPGKVVFFAAEDDPSFVRARFESIAHARDIPLDEAPIFLLDVPELRLETPCHVDRLRATVKGEKPVLVVLDPLIRIARIDENSSSDVSSLLGDLRAIQREMETAILIAHHVRKSQSGSHKGYRLRGSGDFAAWLDSALYLTGSADSLRLQIEHRSSSAPDPIRLRLMNGGSPHLVIADANTPEPTGEPLLDAILDLLGRAQRPLMTGEIRDVVRARKQTVITALSRLQGQGQVTRRGKGWVACTGDGPVPAPSDAGTAAASS